MMYFPLYLSLFIVAYLLGSIPSGYLVTKLSTKKNIMEVGWRKTSSSNVFKNVGAWQAALTMILDVAKGFASVYIAYKLGAPVYVEALCGAIAVLGNNWSIFLNFSGGRGLATLIGGLVFFSPVILLIILIPTILFAIAWTASIGSIISLLLGIWLGFNNPATVGAGMILAFSLVPVFSKKFSPIKEIFSAKNKAELIRNRFLFDQDGIPPVRLKFLRKKG
ncbi:MAG: glycerol-3-phosphate acyltransferase [Candidatus Pacebacteria bacterium]|nr:glycerol-3-phosphate acyltransferase [Candidatus Paceibacterota bacterium]